MTTKCKIVTIALALCMVFWMCVLTGCGNQSLGFGNFTFKHVHFSDAVEGRCATIEKWYDNGQGIEVTTKEYGSMFLSEGSYVLFESDDCPFCCGGS